MQNAFLVVRAIFLTLILYFNLLGTIFAVWNIVSSSSSGMPVPGAAVFLVVNAALIFILVLLAYSAEAICPKARPAHVRFECSWTVLMGVVQLSASVYVTTIGPMPALCQSQTTWTVCASAALLVPISWLATFIMLVYCVTLCVMAATHVYFMPSLWTTPVSAVPWFNITDSALYPVTIPFPPRPLSASSIATTDSDSSCDVSKFIAETWEKLSKVEGRVVEPSNPILRGSSSISSARPVWAKQLQSKTRRGVDQPFATRSLSPSGYSPKVPSPPPKAHARQMPGSNDLKSAQTCSELQLTGNLSRSTLTPQTPTVFPKKIADPDLPIPRPRLSEWIPADAATTLDLHTDGYLR